MATWHSIGYFERQPSSDWLTPGAYLMGGLRVVLLEFGYLGICERAMSSDPKWNPEKMRERFL